MPTTEVSCVSIELLASLKLRLNESLDAYLMRHRDYQQMSRRHPAFEGSPDALWCTMDDDLLKVTVFPVELQNNFCLLAVQQSGNLRLIAGARLPKGWRFSPKVLVLSKTSIHNVEHSSTINIKGLVFLAEAISTQDFSVVLD